MPKVFIVFLFTANTVSHRLSCYAKNNVAGIHAVDAPSNYNIVSKL